MDIEHNVTIEREKEPEKAAEPAFSTFLTAASDMPTFSKDELKMGLDRRWRRQTTRLFRQVEANARSSRP